MREVTFHVWYDGDPSVGIPGSQAEVKTWVVPDGLDFIKDNLKKVFGDIWDCNSKYVRVMTQEELDKDSE